VEWVIWKVDTSSLSFRVAISLLPGQTRPNVRAASAAVGRGCVWAAASSRSARRPIRTTRSWARRSAVAAAREGLFVLDRNAGVVHQIRRDGSVIASLGQGELKQPAALVADRFDRVFVTEPFNRTVQVLQAGEPTQTLTAAQLGVQQISALAVDARLLAVADGLAGQVVIHTLREGPRR